MEEKEMLETILSKVTTIDENLTKLQKNIVIFLVGFGAHCIISAVIVVIYLVWLYHK